jgi:DNA ligase (NAD+)
MNEIKKLSDLIKHHQNLYYNETPELSDEEFDALWDRLKKLDPKNQLLTVKVGVKAVSGQKVSHIIPMGSQQKATNPDAIRKWAKKMNFKEYLVEYKFDGISVELQYEKGIFVRAVSRGDGIEGDDISKVVRKMNGFKNKIDSAYSGAVRGEILMSHSIFNAKYQKIAKNCRNMASGISKRLSGEGGEDLFIKVYDAHMVDNLFPDEKSKIQWVQDQGFDVTDIELFSTVDEIIKYRNKISNKIRDKMDFDIDGLVIKGNEIDLEDMKRARPMKQIAFKFELEIAVSKIIDVEWSINGQNYTPVAVIEPVEICGTTVQRASLANPNLIKKLGLKIGSEVEVSKRGDIIPKIEKIIMTPSNAKKIEIPSKCEVCGSTIENEGTRLYCPNDSCQKREFHRVVKWIKKLGVKDFGEVILGKLFEAGKVSQIGDLYKLKVPDLANLERSGVKSATKALKNLEGKSKQISLAKFIAGFDIDGVGEKTFEKVINGGFDTLEKIRNASGEDLARIDGVGDINADLMVEGLNSLYEQMVSVMGSPKVTIAEKKAVVSEIEAIKGKSFCFTGKLNTLSRNDAQDMVVQYGGSSKSGVSKNLTYLITNTPDSGSSKNKKARDLGVFVITEEEFLKFFEN